MKKKKIKPLTKAERKRLFPKDGQKLPFDKWYKEIGFPKDFNKEYAYFMWQVI